MTLRVALGAKPNSGAKKARQIVVRSPILTHLDMLRIREQSETPLRRFEMLYSPVFDVAHANETALRQAIDGLCGEVVALRLRKAALPSSPTGMSRQAARLCR